MFNKNGPFKGSRIATLVSTCRKGYSLILIQESGYNPIISIFVAPRRRCINKISFYLLKFQLQALIFLCFNNKQSHSRVFYAGSLQLLAGQKS